MCRLNIDLKFFFSLISKNTNNKFFTIQILLNLEMLHNKLWYLKSVVYMVS